VDALLLSSPTRSFAELSLSPAFRRKWSLRSLAFKEPETSDEPDGELELVDERWGKVRLRRWDNKHTYRDAVATIWLRSTR
jgi:hypothetical protein